MMALGLDIPFIDPFSVSEVFNDALQCITLSCSPTNPNRFSSRNTKLLNNSPSVHISTTIRDTPPPIPPPLQVQAHPDVTPQWSSDLDRLSNTFKKFYGRYTDLVGQYKKNVCQMFADSIS